MKPITLYPPLQQVVDSFDQHAIPDERKVILDDIISYIQRQHAAHAPAQLHFICTHNSRRSQLSQVWAHTLARYFNQKVASFSGGVEVTAFNERAVASLKRTGFQITKEGDDNPKYLVLFADEAEPIVSFSKLFDDAANPDQSFAAVMTCSEADENCPFIPGASARIPLRYGDPKAFDDTVLEAKKYDERSLQIAGELYYVFSKIK